MPYAVPLAQKDDMLAPCCLQASCTKADEKCCSRYLLVLQQEMASGNGVFSAYARGSFDSIS